MIWVFLIIIKIFFPIPLHCYIINKPPNIDFIVRRVMGSLGGHSVFIVSANNITVLQSKDVDVVRQKGK